MSARVLLFAAAVFGLSFAAAPRAEALCLMCTCSVSAGDMAFGAATPVSDTTIDAVASIDVSCTGLAAVGSITVRMGSGNYGTIAARKMASGVNRLDYNIYSDAARTAIWGDGSGGYSGVTVFNSLGLLTWNTSTPAYGRMTLPAIAIPGVYTDTVVVTVEF